MGKSTNDVLITLRHYIDLARIEGRTLIIANLDIQEAFDSVPTLAIVRAMKRIKMPTSFINLIENLHKDRLLSISTPFGDTVSTDLLTRYLKKTFTILNFNLFIQILFSKIFFPFFIKSSTFLGGSWFDIFFFRCV